jgi:hypothetical protein
LRLDDFPNDGAAALLARHGGQLGLASGGFGSLGVALLLGSDKGAGESLPQEASVSPILSELRAQVIVVNSEPQNLP